MKVNIFLDFAETIGYAVQTEKELDYEIIRSVVGTKFNIPKNEYGLSKKKDDSASIYSKHQSYRNFFEEKDYCIKYFKKILKKYCLESEIDKLAKIIVAKRFSLCRHKLYPEVLDRLNKYIKFANIFILSDGKPSRKVTLELLGVDRYCKDCFTSDEIGALKNDIKFYITLMSRIDISGRIIYIDDIRENLDTFGRYCKIEKYLINRRGTTTENSSVYRYYKYIDKLPLHF